MNSLAESGALRRESQVLENLKETYVAQGFSFEIAPSPEHVPDFLGTYRPDAIARKPGSNIVIEVKGRRTPATDLTLANIRRRFENQADWKFVIAYTGGDSQKALAIPAFSVAEIRKRLDQIRVLDASGEHRGAFVMGWSLLEAAMHSIHGGSDARPHTPGTVAQTLAMHGYIDAGREGQLRPLISLRNRVVHGDLAAEPSADDVQVILSAVDDALSGVGA